MYDQSHFSSFCEPEVSIISIQSDEKTSDGQSNQSEDENDNECDDLVRITYDMLKKKDKKIKLPGMRMLKKLRKNGLI